MWFGEIVWKRLDRSGGDHTYEFAAPSHSERVTFGRPIADHGVTRQRIADARIMIDGARGAERGVEDGRRRQQGCSQRDRHDQSACAQRCLPGDSEA
jgi:alkylation response protein AidB-like acyl-CoA dehydrogenase